jgi:hypothetical protein
MKEVIQDLDLDYLLWEFKKKWRLLAEVNFKYNIVITEFKLTRRKKKRRKLNILANLFEVGRRFVNNIDVNILISKQNL